ncbi:MAG: hypothetical protein FWG85_06130 [Bacteroidetes bacterium]|nr:hypothetical protein [Bacteroidota bacterium]
MKVIKKLVMYVLLLMLSNVLVFSQILIKNDQSKGGTINNNRGTIRFKSTGALIDLPDYIGGTVIYNAQNPGTEQVVPNIRYNVLIFDSKANLKIDSFSNTPSASTRPLVAADIFIKSGDFTKIRNNKVEIRPEGDIWTNGKVKGRKDVAMIGLFEPQSIYGENNASFSRLRIENPLGVDVTGEITVTNKLELRRGELRNAEGNVKIGDATMDRNFIELVATELNPDADGMDTVDINLERPLVIRYAGASLEERGDFQEYGTDLHYRGIGTIFTGGENPPPDDDSKNIYDLIVENSDSLVLTENMRAVDSIYVGTQIHTTDNDTLILASIKNPGFGNESGLEEVHGHFRRTDWQDGDELIFNNPYTRLFFRDSINRKEISTILSTVFPSRYHDLPNSEMRKVKRLISLRAFNDAGEEYTNNINAQYNYGWRYQGSVDETFNLAFERLMLLHYNGNGQWIPNPRSVLPPQVASPRWGHSYTTDIFSFGDYAIGLQDNNYNLAFSGKVFLEGAYRYFAKRMSNELQTNNYLPMPPPDIYPYNLDPDRVYNFRLDGQFPDSVVDWVVLELRKDYAIPGSVKTLLLKTDGRLVDMWNNEQVLFHSNLEFVKYDSLGRPIEEEVMDTEAEVYVVIRHRNHAAVVSNDPINFVVGKPEYVDFTLPHIVMGGADVLKPIDRSTETPTGFLYGMLAGEIFFGDSVPPYGVIGKDDYNLLIDAIGNWSINTLDGYLLHDVNLSGTVNTMDYNIIFNNRGRTFHLVPW